MLKVRLSKYGDIRVVDVTDFGDECPDEDVIQVIDSPGIRLEIERLRWLLRYNDIEDVKDHCPYCTSMCAQHMNNCNNPFHEMEDWDDG